MLDTTREWQPLSAPAELDPAVIEACGGDTLIARILVGRGHTAPAAIRAFLNPDEYHPAAPDHLPDLPAASQRLATAIERGEKVLIWGDFDVDGQTATALLVDGLSRIGAEVAYFVPNRAVDSHGIKLWRLKEQIAAHQPQVLLTCDTGIGEFEAVDHARRAGLTVLITDHHDLADSLPAADSIVNPKRLPPGHPLRTLPGVGVAFKLMQHLYTTLGRERELPRLLDLVALGIVADVAAQVNDTRYLLQIGLDHLRQTERIGLTALMETANIAPDQVTAERIGFSIGPRLNAVGRMADAALAVELLTTRDRTRAYVLAQQLEALNQQRKLITEQIEGAAFDMLERDRTLSDAPIIVLHHPEWNIGVLGVVANRIAERTLRPAILLGGAGEKISGSARSFGGYDIHTALEACADVLLTQGGHAGAAGLSLRAENLGLLRQRLAKVAANLTRLPAPPLPIDAVISLPQADLDMVARISRLAPFGEGNPAVTFAVEDVRLSHAGTFGSDGSHLNLTVEDEAGHSLRLIKWGGAAEDPSEQLANRRFDVAFTLGADRRGGVEALLTAIRLREAVTPVVDVPEKRTIHDWRRELDPSLRLSLIRSMQPEAQIWAEAYSRADFPAYRRRAELTPAPILIVYTAPPDLATLQAVMAAVDPVEVHVFGLEPPLPTFEAFLRQLTIAVQNVVKRMGGTAPLDVLCGATAASVATVRAGVAFLAAEQGLTFSTENGTLRIREGGPKADRAVLQAANERLRAAYQESEAFRRFFKIQPLRKLLSE